MGNVRKATNKVIEMAEEGVLSWEAIARAALDYMSEDEVAAMAWYNGFIEDEDEEEEKDEDEDD